MATKPRSSEKPIDSPRPSTSGDKDRPQKRGGAPRESIPQLQNVPSSTKGTAGQLVPIQTNLFDLDTKPEWNLYHYDVKFAPEIDGTRLKKKLFNEHGQRLFKEPVYVFDGSSAFSPYKLLQNTTERFVKQQGHDEKVRVTVQLVRAFTMREFDEEVKRVSDIAVRRAMEQMGYKQIGRNYFNPEKRERVNDKVEVWPGCQTSIRQHEGGRIMATVAPISKVVRNETLNDIFRSCQSASDGNIGRAFDLFERNVLGMMILARFGQAKHYRINEVVNEMNPSKEFDFMGEKITFLDYFKQRYGITIKNLDQPILITRCKAREIRGGMPEFLYLVPELCRATGFTDAMRGDFRLMRDIATHTRLSPSDNLRRAVDFVCDLNRQRAFEDWELQLSETPVEVQGRRLPQPNIMLQDKKGNVINQAPTFPVDWTRNIIGSRLYKSATLREWVVVCPDRFRASLDTFLCTLAEVAKGLGFEMAKPARKWIQTATIQNYGRAVQEVKRFEETLEMILLIVPTSNNKKIYDDIKTLCVTELGVASQVVREKTAAADLRQLRTVCTKIAIQMACKLGAQPWSLSLPPKSMFCGFDVFHDTVHRNRSFGAFVASMDMTRSTKFFSAAEPHDVGTELSRSMREHMRGALQAYHAEHKELPDRVVFYRDGVGEGNLRHLLGSEIAAVRESIEEAFAAVDDRRDWKLVVVEVRKRHLVRTYKKTADGGAQENVDPGTVVDSVVTMDDKYDFFMTAHSGRVGLATPTYYNVVEQTSRSGGFQVAPDFLQKITFYLCCLYFNWSGAVTVPAPCLYAHKLAKLMGESVQKAPHEGLIDRLYFL